MSEKAFRNIFIFGTLFFFVILAAMTVDTLRQVRNLREVGDLRSGRGAGRSQPPTYAKR